MAAYSKGKVENLIKQGRLALGNALDNAEILGLLTPLGYGTEKVQEGQVLLQTLEDAHANQLRLYAQQKESTAAFRAAWTDSKKGCKRHSKISQALLDEQPELLARLGLEGPRAKAFEVWQAQAEQFYREALADANLKSLLAEGGLSETVLTTGQSALKTVDKANRDQEAIKGKAQQSTQDRNEAATQFNQWLRNFWKIAEVALVAQPQWLEQLGRKVR